MGNRDAFSEEWRANAPGLSRNLRSLGVSRSDVEDVLQATAERALSNGIAPDGTDHFRAWCYTVAQRIAIDEWRKTKPVLVAVPPEIESSVNVVNEVAGRQALAQFKQEVCRLPAAERNAIVSIDRAGDDRRTKAALAVARHRARRKLAHIMEGLAAVVGGFGSGVKRTLRARRAFASATIVATAATLVVVAPSVPHQRGPGAVRMLPDRVARSAFSSQESRGLGPMSSHSTARVGTTSVTAEPERPRTPVASPLPLPTSPRYGLVPTGDGRSVVEGRPGTDEEEGVALCTATLLTSYQCYYYPDLSAS